MALPKWLQILEQVGPLVLAFTPLAPIAPMVIAGIRTAELIPGATGEQKSALVQQIVSIGAAGANAQAGHELINVADAQATAAAAIATTVGVVNIVHKAHPEDPAPAAPPAA